MQPCIILILEKESWHEANIQKVLLLACALLFLPFFFPFFDLTIKYFATYLHVIINWPSRYEKCKKNNIPKNRSFNFLFHWQYVLTKIILWLYFGGISHTMPYSTQVRSTSTLLNFPRTFQNWNEWMNNTELQS